MNIRYIVICFFLIFISNCILSTDCENCMIFQCNYTTGYCNKCVYGWWGPNCENQCSRNCFTFCERINGSCAQCNQGWYGPDCQKLCPSGCANGCDKVTGCCDKCQFGMVGNCTCSIPLSCASPDGFTCDWYNSCLQKYTTSSCPVIDDVMYDKCQEYLNLEPSLSLQGQRWSQHVRRCIQNILAQQVLVPAPSGQVNCSFATDVFFDNHVDCYLSGPVSFCNLPYLDMGSIVKDGASILFSKYYYEPFKTLLELSRACFVEFAELEMLKLEDGRYSITDDPETSIGTALNKTLLEYQMMLTFLPYSSNTVNNATSLLVLSNTTTMEPIQPDLAQKLIDSTISSWIKENPTYQVTFNGVIEGK
ncbi:hypothetical protein PPL_12416 [Heterostelium album PN500]|uniref:EGF-like domain-containing protein n=1 Tax=Heterostelium pallidum (strain ATCC 26659 / Pp 5 / PN500) TaxID=670386 RepID=D3BMJ5_HETP5|nr:hypothetical protein PPL_12416 [Heterostelium album PN500]EFA77207.1 hypothetical protein PPL_12416 [Heterostelium album PN500]|eukprot:XP_020429336.1 hypothetical protein PPL_12416 [Heterostelium album PN500]